MVDMDKNETSEQEWRSPARLRSPVLNDDPAAIVAKLMSNPGEWLVIAGAERAKRGTLSQTGHRIRTGRYSAFRTDEPGGKFETSVSMDRSDDSRGSEVELFARYVVTPDSGPDAA